MLVEKGEEVDTFLEDEIPIQVGWCVTVETHSNPALERHTAGDPELKKPDLSLFFRVFLEIVMGRLETGITLQYPKWGLAVSNNFVLLEIGSEQL